jgi:mycofactocin precursor
MEIFMHHGKRCRIIDIIKIIDTKEDPMENERQEIEFEKEEEKCERPSILEEVNIEELAIDGICGIY